MLKTLGLIAAMAISLVHVSPAFSMEDGPCKADRETYCKDVKHGHGKIMKCFKENEDKLSAECKAHIADKKEHMKEAAKEIGEACKADIETHCGDVKKGKMRVMKCMKENKDKLSDACKAEIKEQRGKAK